MVMKQSAAKATPVGQAKTHLLSMVSDVQANGTTHILTKRGKPVAKLSPIECDAKPFRPLWGRTKGWMTIKGDIVGPACPEENWEALAD
jgi:antitoxin (DNA-binding transcriptional repressor) of toxin-antitoxin stability system